MLDYRLGVISNMEKMEEQKVFCPLCDSPMKQDGKHYRCIANNLHLCLIDKEWGRHKSGEKDVMWLQFRMKVRLGKMVTGR